MNHKLTLDQNPRTELICCETILDSGRDQVVRRSVLKKCTKAGSTELRKYVFAVCPFALFAPSNKANSANICEHCSVEPAQR